MEIKKLYAKDIDRHINPAVVVGETDEKYKKQEIEEYVFTKDILANIYKFLDAVVNKKEGKTGIWISGYYGSGKSHFIKYLFYCLNQATRAEALNRYKEGLKSSKDFDDLSEVTLSNVQLIENELNKTEVEEIIFNIDYVSQHSKNINTITRILFNELNAKRGYNKSNIAVALLIEKPLDKIGKLDAFKKRVQQEIGEEWKSENVSNHISLKLSKIIDIVAEFDPIIDKDALRSAIKEDRDFTIEELVTELKEFLQDKPEKYRLVFLIDEVSQYIGSNSDLLLNLQTIVEGFGENLQNKVWVVCTAQQDLSNLVNVFENKSDGFGKIMGRFETMISLDSQDTAYITQKRILDKNADGIGVLTPYYKENKGAIENQFVMGHSLYQNFKDSEEFYLSYPFIPYQFRLISDVFSSFSKIGFVMEGVKNSERAILGITHTTAKNQSHKDVGYFISFDNFFNDKLTANLTQEARSILGRATNITFSPDLKPFANRVINVLFMVSNLDEAVGVNFPPTVENLSLLLLNDVRTVKAELQSQVQKILDILVDNNIVQVSEGKYRFLDDEGVKVANTISQTEVNSNTRLKYFYEQFIQKSLKPNTTVSVGGRNVRISLFIDDKEEASGGDFKVKFVVFDLTDPEMQALNIAANELNVNITEWYNADADFKKNFLNYCKTTKYLEDNRASATGARLKALEEFQQGNAKILKDLQIRFDKAMMTTSFTSSQTVIAANVISGANPAAKYSEMLTKHLETLYKYNDWAQSYAQNNADLQSAVDRGLRMPTTDNELNQAEQEVNNKITQAGNQINLSELVKIFEKAPYGWKDLATLQMVFNIVNKKHRALYYLNDEMELKNFYDKALNSSSRNSIEVKSSKEYNPEEINNFKDGVKKIFVTYNFANGQTVAEMIASFHDFIGDLLLEINQYKENHDGYPFSSSIKNYHSVLAELKQTKSNDKLIKLLLEQQANIQQLRDQYTTTKDFIDNNFSAYKDIRDFASDQKSNIDKLGEDYEERIQDLNSYMQIDSNPAEKFPYIKKAYKELKKAIEDYMVSLREETVKRYTEIFDELDAKKHELGITASHIIADRNYVLERLQKSKDLNLLDLELAKAGDFRVDNLKILAQEKHKMQVAEKPGTTYGENIETVKITDTIAGETISTAEEVDALMEKIKNKLMVALGKNGKIFLK